MMEPYENSNEQLPVEVFRKILYNGFYYIQGNNIYFERNAVFIGNGYFDQMVKTHPFPQFISNQYVGEHKDAHYWDWGNKDEVCEFKDYGKTWSIDREELKKIIALKRNFAVVEKIFSYKGHECICIFHKNGYRCGYVSIDNEMDTTTMNLDIDCHCGLSFCDKLFENYEQTEDKYIGFDCGHICDGRDFKQAFKYGLISQEELDTQLNEFSYLQDNPIRDLNYVIENCKKIIDQLENRGEIK